MKPLVSLSQNTRVVIFLAIVVALLAAETLSAQPAPVNGMRPSDLRSHAIVDATVIAAPGRKIEHATILIRDGVIQDVGTSVTVPPEARIWPGKDLWVYAGLIEPALLIKPADATRGPGSYWNSRVHPELNMADQPGPDKALRKDLRALGFTAAAVYPAAGAFRGSGVVIALADENEYTLAYKDRAAMAAGFDFGGGGRRGGEGTEDPNAGASGYPSSLMGAIALLRQSLYDAQWHSQSRQVWQQHPSGNEPPTRSDAMVALADVLVDNHKQQVLFEVSDEQNALRAARLGKEFNLDMILLGSGDEFRRINEIAQTKLPIIVPLDFPKRPDVSTIAAADAVTLRDMMTWEQAPTNPRRLLKAGVTIALTTHSLKSRSDFPGNLRSAIKHGLSEDEALAAITTTPAKMLGLENMLGTIEKGKAANLVVVKGSLFDKDSKIRDTWVNGRRYEISKDPEIELKGSGTLKLHTPIAKELKIDVDTLKSTVTFYLADDKKVSAKKVSVTNDQISIVTDGKPFGTEGYVRLSGVIEGNTVTGNGVMPDETSFSFVIEITAKTETGRDGGKTGGEAQEQSDDDKKDDDSQKPDAENREPSADSAPSDPISGTWHITFEEMREGMTVSMTLKLQSRSVSGTYSMMGRDRDVSGGTFDASTGKLSFSTESPGGSSKTDATVSGDSMTGTISGTRGDRNFTASRETASGGAGDKKGGKKEEKFVMPPEELNFPLGEYAVSAPPKPESVLIHNATIWTCDAKGTVIKNGWIMVNEGKIADIGSGEIETGVSPRNRMIDAQGRHITPGLIDCHSHTGIDGSVNEGAQTNSAECRIGDCIDPDDINFYRQLAGGLTACNQLHGSANPIGGQNSVVKLKWGAAGGADAFPIKDAIPGIKFALGENVKRSTGRYPNSRMGVETFDRDAFTAAKDYKATWERYNKLGGEAKKAAMPPRRDLELDTLAEILDHKRIIHCHSYRQDEILMLIRLADSFGFTIGTFQHVLEGYKVADAIAKHGAGGSSFSDWWAYKVEVMDAVPYNGALMHDVGVLVSFNSDSDELARRMNCEAAKAVRYGGISPEEALKFVTINPAKQLRIDNRTGSLEKGKDADFVVWSGDPLSTYTRCEQTWIEGAKYFDLETDKAMRETIQRERQRIIQKILVQAHGEIDKPKDASQSQPSSAPSSQPGGPKLSKAHQEWIEEQLRLGRDPNEVRPGECGCNDEWAHSHETGTEQ